jgi:hypothetical protein
MNNKMRKTRIAGMLLSAFFLHTAYAADQGNFSLTSGLDYSSGKYGGTQSTQILYIPLTGKYEVDRWAFKLTVPYVRITGPGGVTRDTGVYKASGTTRTTASGLGDVVAGASYNLYASGVTNALLVDLTGKVKFGTADETKGLGTGKTDYAAQVDIYKTVNQFTVFGTLGYKVLGSPAGTQLNNVREKAFATGAPQRELTAFVTHKLDTNWKTQAYLVKGFADGSPDWGGGAMLTRAF